MRRGMQDIHGPRGMQDLKGKRSMDHPSMPYSHRSTFLDVFTLDVEKRKLGHEIEILTQQIERNQRGIEKRSSRVEEIKRLILELVGSEVDIAVLNEMRRKTRGAESRSEIACKLNEGTDKEQEYDKKDWQTIKLEY
ncbi:hypothetical protein FJZ31_38140 [Candidatus Poribacteria bacterium]|nr:hypothetical protein [Candidatus Poribacteria bacterium]